MTLQVSCSWLIAIVANLSAILTWVIVLVNVVASVNFPVYLLKRVITGLLNNVLINCQSSLLSMAFSANVFSYLSVHFKLLN